MDSNKAFPKVIDNFGLNANLKFKYLMDFNEAFPSIKHTKH